MRSTSAAQRLHVGGRGLLRHAAADELVEHGAKLVDLVGFLDRDLAHEDAAVLLEADEARLLERAKRLAHGSARNPEELGDRDLVELGAGRELAGEDHALDLALHQAGERMRLQHRDGVRARGRGPGRARGVDCAVAGLQHVAIRRGGV